MQAIKFEYLTLFVQNYEFDTTSNHINFVPPVNAYKLKAHGRMNLILSHLSKISAEELKTIQSLATQYILFFL
jgi:hypothetical protein